MSITVFPSLAEIKCNRCGARYSRRRQPGESAPISTEITQHEAEQAGWLVSDHGDLCAQCAEKQVNK